MKQILKETIIVWISLILILASVVSVLFVVPCLFFTCIGKGEWQFIVCVLWLLFWLSFVIAVVIRRERNKEGEDKK